MTSCGIWVTLLSCSISVNIGISVVSRLFSVMSSLTVNLVSVKDSIASSSVALILEELFCVIVSFPSKTVLKIYLCMIYFSCTYSILQKKVNSFFI